MLELIQITNDVEFARRCDDMGGFRLWVDLERMGKAERQAGRNTFISVHSLEDVGRVKSALRHSQLMVRVNPLHEGTRAEVDAVIGAGADLLMLPMFHTPSELREFVDIVHGRVPVIPLLETAQALACVDEWIATPGLGQVYVGLNDLHISLGHRFMFQPLALGMVDRVAAAANAQGLSFGFGGIARMDEGHLPGRDVLAEHLRLGSSAVILSRTFHRAGEGDSFEDEVAKLRSAEVQLSLRTSAQIDEDAKRIHAIIHRIAAAMESAR
ncbi:aldolase/citrate lyase family protein [Caenimonas sp. SL110]|uniref:aldolase/citrate lyase family protein n=1 Tax=Caenimonas sp. SL110 TaxID=1450524 RepID=UPI000653EE10|nr:aldolase/citrate lyase family protein [Caenimonas sp. SL110]